MTANCKQHSNLTVAATCSMKIQQYLFHCYQLKINLLTFKNINVMKCFQ